MKRKGIKTKRKGSSSISQKGQDDSNVNSKTTENIQIEKTKDVAPNQELKESSPDQVIEKSPMSTKIKRTRQKFVGDRSKNQVCPICSKVIVNAKNLAPHIRKHEPTYVRKTSKNTPSLCHLCGRKFIHMNELEIHLRSHVGDMANSCEVCGKSFLRLSTLNRHVRTVHTNERSFKCQHCSKSYTGKCALKRHERSHSDPSTHFQCVHCDKKFALKSVLMEHEMTHFPLQEKYFRCNLCSAKFFKAYLLKQHMRIHTNEKPYICECGKGFSQKGNLNIHQKTHEGFKKFRCTKCDKGYTRAEYLQRHEEENHAQTSGAVRTTNKRGPKTKTQSSALDLRTKLSGLGKGKSPSKQVKKKSNKSTEESTIIVVLTDKEAVKDENNIDVKNFEEESVTQDICIVKENAEEDPFINLDEPFKEEEVNDIGQGGGSTVAEIRTDNENNQTTINQWIINMG